MESLKERAAKGLIWGTFTRGATQLLNVVIGIFLARLLSPADIGLVGMITIFTVLASNLQESGFFTALVNKKDASHDDYNSVFWFCLSFSIVIYIVLFFSAPLIASFFHQPELLWLSRFVFLSFMISAVGIAHSAWMFSRLMVRQRAVIMVVSLIVSGTVGIVLAMRGYSYWSLAWQQVIFNLVFNIGRLSVTRWHPTFSFTFRPIREMFRFSNKILIPTVINTISQYFLSVVFGRFYPAHTVGYFTQAFKWNTMGYQFVGDGVAQIAQPVMVEVREEKERSRRVLLTMLRYTAFMSFPALFGLAMCSEEFIVQLLTAKWQPAVPILQVLCIGGAFMPFYKIYQNFIISHGRSDIYMWLNICQIIVQFAVVICTRQWGIMSMVAAYTVVNILWLGLWQQQAKRLSAVGWSSVARTIVPFLVVAMLSMVATWFITQSLGNLTLRLIARIAVGAGIYIALLKLFRFSIIDECWQFVSKRKRA